LLDLNQESETKVQHSPQSKYQESERIAPPQPQQNRNPQKGRHQKQACKAHKNIRKARTKKPSKSQEDKLGVQKNETKQQSPINGHFIANTFQAVLPCGLRQ
jgi:hypothetical protein